MTGLAITNVRSNVYQTDKGLARYDVLVLNKEVKPDDPLAKKTISKDGKTYIPMFDPESKKVVFRSKEFTVLSDDEAKNYTTDGKRISKEEDDGRIDWLGKGGKLESMWNGIKKPFVGLADKLVNGSWKDRLLTGGLLIAGIAAAIAFPVTVGFIGLALGVGTLAVGGYQAATAKSDAEAKNAWENIGNGVFTTAASFMGIKAAKFAAANKAAAIENATGKTAGTINKLGDIGQASNETVAYGPLGKVSAGVSNFIKKFKVLNPRDGYGATKAEIANNAAGFAKAKLGGSFNMPDKSAIATRIATLKSEISADKSSGALGAAYKKVQELKLLMSKLEVKPSSDLVNFVEQESSLLEQIPAFTKPIKASVISGASIESNLYNNKCIEKETHKEYAGKLELVS